MTKENHIIIYKGNIPINLVKDKYLDYKKRYPNYEIILYYKDIVISSQNEDELDFITDDIFYFYFVALRKWQNLDKMQRIAKAKYEMQMCSLDMNSLQTSEQAFQYLSSCSSLDDALLYLKSYTLSYLAKGFIVIHYEEFLAIIKQRFPLKEIAKKRNLTQAKRTISKCK